MINTVNLYGGWLTRYYGIVSFWPISEHEWFEIMREISLNYWQTIVLTVRMAGSNVLG